MSAPSTFDLSALYSALGVRSKNALAKIDPGLLLPVIVMGNVETFAPAVIEARGVIGATEDQSAANNWAAYSMFSTAPGGAVVEQITHGLSASQQLYFLNVAPQRPFTGAVMSTNRVLSTGGRPLTSIVEFLKAGIPRPQGNLLGGTQTQSETPELAAGIWVPPGWFFWIVFENTTAGVQTFNMSFRWRELLEAQGAA